MSEQDPDQVQVFLGDEYDRPLHAALLVSLADLGVVLDHQGEWSVAGSQELWQMDIILDGKTIHIESETYIGLSIAGPVAIVEKIQAQLNKNSLLHLG